MARAKKRSRRKQAAEQAPSLKTWALWAVVGCCVVGGALALYATDQTIKIEQSGLAEPSMCSINEWINCDAAHASSYANLLGIPVAWWGFLFYLAVGLSALYATLSSNRSQAASAVSIGILLGIGAVLFSIYKATNLVTLGILCPVCVAMYIVNAAILVLLILALSIPFGKLGGYLSAYVKKFVGAKSDLGYSPRPLMFGIFLIVFFGFGFMGMKNYTNKALAAKRIENFDFALRAHYRQEQKEITYDETAPVWGNPDAELTIVEFADFECPGCKQAASHMRGLLYEFRDDVKFVFMNYPLDTSINQYISQQIHINAGLAARAAVCSAKQGDFWDYHDEIFSNQGRQSRELMIHMAEDRGWDTQQFATCLDDPETIARVKSDIESGQAADVQSTPSVYINGRLVRYWSNSEFVRTIIKQELDQLQ